MEREKERRLDQRIEKENVLCGYFCDRTENTLRIINISRGGIAFYFSGDNELLFKQKKIDIQMKNDPTYDLQNIPIDKIFYMESVSRFSLKFGKLSKRQETFLTSLLWNLYSETKKNLNRA